MWLHRQNHAGTKLIKMRKNEMNLWVQKWKSCKDTNSVMQTWTILIFSLYINLSVSLLLYSWPKMLCSVQLIRIFNLIVTQIMRKCVCLGSSDLERTPTCTTKTLSCVCISLRKKKRIRRQWHNFVFTVYYFFSIKWKFIKNIFAKSTWGEDYHSLILQLTG